MMILICFCVMMCIDIFYFTFSKFQILHAIFDLRKCNGNNSLYCASTLMLLTCSQQPFFGQLGYKTLIPHDTYKFYNFEKTIVKYYLKEYFEVNVQIGIEDTKFWILSLLLDLSMLPQVLQHKNCKLIYQMHSKYDYKHKNNIF